MMPNYFAVFIAAVAMMALGFLWYSPMILGKQWMKLKGYTEKSLKEAQKTMGPKYALSFAGSLVTAYILGWVIKATGMSTVSGGLGTAFLMWLGFVTTTQLTGWIFSDSKKELYFIDTGYQLVSLLVMGIILGMWK